MGTSPEVGKRYRITREMTVTELTPDGRIRDKRGGYFSTNLYEWEELEPEYEEDALYLDAIGTVFRRRPRTTPTSQELPWFLMNMGPVHDSRPVRPLIRLYREDEIE